MHSDAFSRIFGRVGQQSHGAVLDLFGPTVEFLTAPNGRDPLCVMRGVVPPGAIVALHSHGDAETFFVISGSKEVLVEGGAGLEWHRVNAGDYVDIASGSPHAWRNDTSEPAVDLIVTTRRMGRFFQEVGRPAEDAGPPSPEDLGRFAAVAATYGYWLATPEQNAAVGIELPPSRGAGGPV